MSTDQDHRRVLVAGATGRFGGVADVLLRRGHSVRAITRNPSSDDARRLRAAGAEVVFADFDDPEGIARAATGVDAIFAAGTAHRAGPDGELRHGLHLAEAAATARVRHLVFCSGDGAAPDSPVPLFRVKHSVEESIRSLPIAHTILAPVYLMENLFNPWNVPALRAGTLPSPIPVELPLQQVAIADIAELAAIAIERPGEFASQRISIASDTLTAEQASRILSRAAGRHFDAEQTPRDQLAPGLQALFGWLERTGHDVDTAALHRRYPEIGWHDYGAWLRSQEQRLLELCPREHALLR